VIDDALHGMNVLCVLFINTATAVLFLWVPNLAARFAQHKQMLTLICCFSFSSLSTRSLSSSAAASSGA